MAVSVSKLWREGRFNKLSTDAKLLYIYLVTSPDINTLGLLSTPPESIAFDLGINDSVFRQACVAINEKFITIFKVSDVVYFFVFDHFATLPKSVAVSKKAHKDLGKLPDVVVEKMKDLDIMPDIEKHVEFKAPTVEEVEAYAQENGYLIEGRTVVDFYEGKAKQFGKKGWYDSKGKPVRDWRSKLKKVWFKDDRKLKECKGAPKGFEYFVVKDGDRSIAPDYWKDGKPYANTGIIDNKMLQREYAKRSNNK